MCSNYPGIDLFSVCVLFSHFRPRDATPGNSFFQMSSYARANVRITNKKTKGKFFSLTLKYANLWGFCCRRRRGCLSSLLIGSLRNHDDDGNENVTNLHI